MHYSCPSCELVFDSDEVEPHESVTCSRCQASFRPQMTSQNRILIHPPHDVVVTPIRGDLQPGQIIGDFTIASRVGQGRHGTIYRASKKNSPQTLALKILNAEFTEASDANGAVSRIQSCSQLRDIDGLLCVDEVGVIGKRLVVASEFVEAMPITDWASSTRIDLLEAIDLLTRVAAPLAEAHRRGWTHGNLKPNNVVVFANGEPCITDIWVHGAMDESEVPTEIPADDAFSSVPYLAPEQIEGESHQVDMSVDVYAFGAMMYELITGSAPFPGDSPRIHQQIMLGDVETPKSLNPNITERLQNVCLRSMSPDPSDRYTSFDEVITDLEDSSYELAALMPAVPSGNVYRVAAAVAGVIAAIVLFAIGLALLLSNEHAQIDPLGERGRSVTQNLPSIEFLESAQRL